ncbi:MAG: hypothetical protein R3264_21470 [Anaerolineae bacterium]|nr:hypothetical protein [Anaerolineae bacterium]
MKNDALFWINFFDILGLIISLFHYLKKQPITRFHAQFDHLVACVQHAATAATRTLSILGYATNGYGDPEFGTSGIHL